MKFARLAFPLIFLALTTQADAQAQCRPGTVVACTTILGKPGTRTCLGEGEGYGPCEATPSPPVTEIIFGKYLVLTVIYAPPGTTAPQTTTGEQSFGSVIYESDSSTGSTTTNSSSFKTDYKISVNVECELCVLGPNGGASFEYTKNTTQSNAININKKTSSVIAVPAPVEDGVDHNFDQIWLFLHPKYDVTINGTDITWALDPNQSGFPQYLYVGQLKGLFQISPGLLQDLQTAGITPADYQDILNNDPLAQCLAPPVAQSPSPQARVAPPLPVPPAPCLTPAPTSPRYVSANQNLPYNQPATPGNAVPLQTYSVDNSSVSTQTNSYEYDYSVGMTAGIGGDIGPGVNETLTVASTWTWTEMNTTAAQTGTEQKSSLIMGGPAYGYSGPNNMDVYYDTTYKTFAFVPSELSPDALHGTILSGEGKPAVGQLVTATAAGVKYRTYTNAKGEYHFSKQFTGPIDVQAGSAALHLATLEAGKSVDLRLQ
jgi:hypothetical protein